jgi:hypothetical protein
MIGTDLTWKHGAGGVIDLTCSEHPRYPVCRLEHWLLVLDASRPENNRAILLNPRTIFQDICLGSPCYFLLV